ncbi:hypothetical protein Bca52824_011028 [Brassica carinata]|uniref:Arabidopsis retrotransposon Orf1 C-terminal domain-containing protein n=1 Tax=Brassica carinata TaxID=52824 RepID=A0A8X8BAQ5_BRACI|nr:hypothetical protein Bca52824_011028 [Brassica carinata]
MMMGLGWEFENEFTETYAGRSTRTAESSRTDALGGPTLDATPRQDEGEHAGLPKGKTLAHFTYKFLSGKDRVSSRDKNASIRHPSVRYLHRLIVHTIYPRKEPSNVNGEDLNLMHQAIQHFALSPHLPEVPTDFCAEFDGTAPGQTTRLMTRTHRPRNDSDAALSTDWTPPAESLPDATPTRRTARPTVEDAQDQDAARTTRDEHPHALIVLEA